MTAHRTPLEFEHVLKDIQLMNHLTVLRSDSHKPVQTECPFVVDSEGVPVEYEIIDTIEDWQSLAADEFTNTGNGRLGHVLLEIDLHDGWFRQFS